jgi:hypothetical protein
MDATIILQRSLFFEKTHELTFHGPVEGFQREFLLKDAPPLRAHPPS